MFGKQLTIHRRVALSISSSGVAALLLLALISIRSLAQSPPAESKEPSQMLLTSEGLLAIETPKGWVQTEGPGLAFFVRQGENSKTANVWMYISTAPVGPDEDAKDFHAYIKSDIAGFRERFKNGAVREEAAIDLPRTKTSALVYTFESNEQHNSFEEIVYIPESGRVLLLVLSAKNKDAFAESVPDFRAFAKSYGGSIIMTGTKQP